MVKRVDRSEDRNLMIQVDGEEKGGIVIPEIRDSDNSVIIVMKVGLKHTTGLHWHERKDGKSSQLVKTQSSCPRPATSSIWLT